MATQNSSGAGAPTPHDSGGDLPNNWKLLADDIAGLVTEKQQNSSRGLGVNNIITIVCCLFTLLGGTVGVYFVNSRLNVQNQQLQIQLSNFQKENNTATLQFVEIGTNSFTIKNTGKAEANNVKLTASIIYVYNNWLKYASNIGNFEISPSNASLLNSPPSDFKNHVPGAEEFPGNNTVRILLNTLPPGESFTVGINLLPSLANKQASFNRDVNAFFHSTQSIAPYNTAPQSLGEDALAAYFANEIFGVAAFDLNESCDNCVGASSTSTSISSSDAVLIDSAAEVSPLIASETALPSEIIQEDVKIAGTYAFPGTMKPISIPLIPLSFIIALKTTPPAQAVPEIAQAFLSAQSAQRSLGQAIFAWPEYILQSCSPPDCSSISAS